MTKKKVSTPKATRTPAKEAASKATSRRARDVVSQHDRFPADLVDDARGTGIDVGKLQRRIAAANGTG